MNKMQPKTGFFLVIKMLLPLLVAIALAISPVPYRLAEDLRDARSSRALGQHALTVIFLQDALRIQPWRTDLLEALGQAAYANKQEDVAFAALQTAERSASLSADGQILLGDLYAKRGDSSAAAQTWHTLLKQGGPLPAVYGRLFHLYTSQHDLSAAVATLRDWLRSDLQNAQVTFWLGEYLCVFSPDEALPLLQRAANLDGQFSADVQELRKGLSQGVTSQGNDPNEIAYRNLMMGRALARIHEWELAEVAFQQATDANPNYAEAWAFLAEARFQLGMGGKAELEKALALDKNSVAVRALQALYLRRSGQPAQAIETLTAISRQEPQEATWEIELGNTWAEQGNLSAALEHFQAATRVDAHSLQTWQALAQFSAQYQVQLREIGLPAARQMLAISPDNPQGLDMMGWVLLSLGDNASAERFLQRSFQKDSTSASTALHLGWLYLNQNDPTQAHPYLKQAVQLGEKKNPNVSNTAKRLLLRYFQEGE